MPIVDQDNCPCRGSTLPRLLRPAMLAVLTCGEAHGYVIIRKLHGMRIFGQTPPEHSSVYRTLKAMEAEGLLRADWDQPRSGPSRHVFRITDAGRKCLARWEATLDKYGRAISEMLDGIRRLTKRGQ